MIYPVAKYTGDHADDYTRYLASSTQSRVITTLRFIFAFNAWEGPRLESDSPPIRTTPRPRTTLQEAETGIPLLETGRAAKN